MAYAKTDDGVKLYYEEVGNGLPIIFVHEFAGDHRSWEPQMRYFSRRYRCIAYSARGYPPSDIPGEVSSYSQERAVKDIAAVLHHLEIAKAHVVGLSMGGFATLHFGFEYSELASSIVVAGCGYGAEPEHKEMFWKGCKLNAELLESEGSEAFAKVYASSSTRVQFENKDPRGWQQFADQLAQHSALGSANTMRGVQMERPSLWDLVDDMKKLRVPTLVITGDEDDPCLVPAMLMKRHISSAGVTVLPKTGHTINLEEPAAFNDALENFFHAVESGRWGQRDPRSVTDDVFGRVRR